MTDLPGVLEDPIILNLHLYFGIPISACGCQASSEWKAENMPAVAHLAWRWDSKDGNDTPGITDTPAEAELISGNGHQSRGQYSRKSLRTFFFCYYSRPRRPQATDQLHRSASAASSMLMSEAAGAVPASQALPEVDCACIHDACTVSFGLP